jgi:hypothetical protein
MVPGIIPKAVAGRAHGRAVIPKEFGYLSAPEMIRGQAGGGLGGDTGEHLPRRSICPLIYPSP